MLLRTNARAIDSPAREMQLSQYKTCVQSLLTPTIFSPDRIQIACVGEVVIELLFLLRSTTHTSNRGQLICGAAVFLFRVEK